MHLYPTTFLYSTAVTSLPSIPSFTTRRSSDLSSTARLSWLTGLCTSVNSPLGSCLMMPNGEFTEVQDRKSTRLNSSHRCISYDVFCLKIKYIFDTVLNITIEIV